jgi:hypothetical protein
MNYPHSLELVQKRKDRAHQMKMKMATELNLLQSFSTIHKNPSRSHFGSRPRKHSTNNNVQGQWPSQKAQPQGHKRATVSGPVPTICSSYRSQTPTAGIVKSHNDEDPSQNNRVSFSPRQDGSIHNQIASFDAKLRRKRQRNVAHFEIR